MPKGDLCSICQRNYKNYFAHLESPEHLKFIEEDQNNVVLYKDIENQFAELEFMLKGEVPAEVKEEKSIPFTLSVSDRFKIDLNQEDNLFLIAERTLDLG